MMGNKITTIITTFIVLMIFILMVSFITTDQQIDTSVSAVQNFAETIRYNGYITYDQYVSLLNKLPYKYMRVEITHILADNDNKYSNGTLDMRFTSQILGDKDNIGYIVKTIEDVDINSGTLLYNGSPTTSRGIYKMAIGDQVQVDLVVMDTTFFDSIISIISGKATSPIKILTSASGVVLNEKYDKTE